MKPPLINHYLYYFFLQMLKQTWFITRIVNMFSVPARISKGQGAGPEKGHFSALLDFQKRHVLGTL
jgi:hypothetical protein